MDSDIDTVDLPEQQVIRIRGKSDLPSMPKAIREMYDRLLRFAERQGIRTVGPPYAAYHRYGPEGVDMECGFPVDKEAEGEGEIHGGRLTGGRFVHILHVGPYQELGEAYGKLDGWMNENGHRPNGPPREVYLDDPEDTDHHELRTEIYWPVE